MRAILYDPDDAPLVIETGNLLLHIEDCAACSRHSRTPSGQADLKRIITRLNFLTPELLSVDDLGNVLQFCAHWLLLHDTLSSIDALTVEFVERPDGRHTNH